MNANTNSGTRIDLSDVATIRFDIEPMLPWITLFSGKQYRLTLSELHTLVVNRTVFV